MLDRPEKTRELVDVLTAALPFEVELPPHVVAHLRSQEIANGLEPRQTVSQASYAGDEGGIVCHLRSKETDNVIILSLTRPTASFPAVCHSGVRLPETQGQEIEEANGRAIRLMKKRTITVNDTMQRGYRYQLLSLLAETLIRSSIQG